MFSSQYLGYALFIVGIFTAYMAVVSFFGGKNRDRIRDRQFDATRSFQEEEAGSPLVTVLGGLLITLGIDVNKQRESAAQLARAGINGQDALVCFVFFKIVIQPILFVLGGLLLVNAFVLGDDRSLGHNMLPLIVGLLFVVSGAFGSKLYLTNTAQHRTEAIARSFPEALDLMLICVESGLGIDAAFGRVCREIKETHPIISSEFERTRFEMSMMNDRVQALQNLAERTDYIAVRSFVASLVQAERFGTSLVETLRLIAEEQRTERMMSAEKKAARLPALITIPLICFILPSLVIIILGPVGVKISAQGGIFGGGR